MSQCTAKTKKLRHRHTDGDLSYDDLLFLLSLLEGELQARDEVISVWKPERIDTDLLEAHYGFRGRKRVLLALQRDSWSEQDNLEDVFNGPATKPNQIPVFLFFFLYRLELLLAKEREYHKLKEKDTTEIATVHEELSKLQTLAQLVVKEQQCVCGKLEKQKLQIKKAGAYNRVLILQQTNTTMTAPSLLSEVEVLRRRVVEMEGKDEELMRMAEQCQDLDRRLAKETSHCRSLKVEVDKLSSRISELDRIEEALGKSKQDCYILKGSLEREKDVSKTLSGELDSLRLRVRELESFESQMEESEMVLKQDLAKLRSLTMALVQDRKSATERCRQAEEKLNRKESNRNEQSNLVTVAERLRVEKQQELKTRVDLEERLKGVVREKKGLQDRLEKEEEKNIELQNKITMMKNKLQILENRKEKDEKYNPIPNNSSHLCRTEDNKVKNLTQEVDVLRKKLLSKELLEEELIKVEENFESLERRFKDEKRRSRVLTEELELAKRELSKYEVGEKQEVNQEHLLLCRLQKEQVKSRLLRREVDSLKDKLQKLMGTEESICKVQMDQSTLQRKLTQQEAKNNELAENMEELISELDRYRQKKNLQATAANREASYYYQTTKEVQTEPTESMRPVYQEACGSLDEVRDQNHNSGVVNKRSSLVHGQNSLNSANNNSSCSAHPGTDMHQNRDVMMLTHTPGQPLHIKVTPHHMLNTATLEISSPTADAAASYKSTAIIPTGTVSPNQRLTIIQNSGPATVNLRSPCSSPEQVISPLNGMPVSRVLTPNSSRSLTPDRSNSPIQIVAVRTCTSPEPTESINQTIFSQTSEQQGSWQHHKHNSLESNPSVITTEDSRIHIHLGSPYIHSPTGIQQSAGPYYLRHEQRTQVVANGCHLKGVGKITSSITISPSTATPLNIFSLKTKKQL
uniref:Filamin A-interacting protein 1-like n=1 Tax=Gouania willdenowi TaxID=441366 RepID=A0A8C5GG71_GOUWI